MRYQCQRLSWTHSTHLGANLKQSYCRGDHHCCLTLQFSVVHLIYIYQTYFLLRQLKRSMRSSTDWRLKNVLISEITRLRKRVAYQHLRVWTGGRTVWSVLSKTKWDQLFKKRKWTQPNEKPPVVNTEMFSVVFLRARVGPAGLSAPWELLRPRWRSKQESLFPLVHRTWWTAAPTMETTAAVEDSFLKPLNTSSAMEALTQKDFTPMNMRLLIRHKHICI